MNDDFVVFGQFGRFVLGLLIQTSLNSKIKRLTWNSASSRVSAWETSGVGMCTQLVALSKKGVQSNISQVQVSAEKSERNCLSVNDLIFVVKRSVYRHSVVLGRDRCRFPININFYKHHGTDYYARVNQPSDCISECLDCQITHGRF